ncbi:MAG: hypothetical protein E7181_03780 [Erysipelotrichaceae bacterium]|nr:hypothetical protein [Erysipelotrichaceae bacterium]
MKKNLILTVMLAGISLTACGTSSPSSSESQQSSQPDINTLKIISPSGAPAIGLYNMFKNGNVEINADANNVLSYLSADSSKDVVIAPTNALVSKVMGKIDNFKIAANITFGNFYLASVNTDGEAVMTNDSYVVLFQQNQLPDRLFKYVYGDEFTNLHYVTAASDAAKCAITGKNETDNNAKVDFVLVPQPALTNVLANSKANAKLYKNIQEDFKTKSGGLEITQASIFVNTKSDEATIKAFLDKISKDINDALANPSLLKQAVEGLSQEELTNKFGVGSGQLLQKMIADNAIRIGYKRAFDNKRAIDNFLKALKFTLEDTSEEVYYK